MRYDRACKNLDRHPNYTLAADLGVRHLTGSGEKRLLAGNEAATSG